MPAFHVSLFFTTREHSWVEQFWRVDSGFRPALAAGLALAQARYSILGSGAALYRVRVTSPDTPRAYATMDVAGTPQAMPAESPLLGVYVRLDGGSQGLHRRPYFLRAFPKGAIIGQFGPARWSPAWSAAGEAWLALLTQGWSLEVEVALGPELPVMGLALSSTAAADIFGNPLDPEDPPEESVYTVATLPVALPAGSQKLLVRGGTGNPPLREVKRGINGSKVIVSTSGPNVVWRGDFGPGIYTGGGMAQPQMRGYVPITRAVLTRTGSRHAGPPRAGDLAVNPGSPAFVSGSVTPPTGTPAGPAPPGPPATPLPPPTLSFRSARDIVRQIYTSYVSPDNPTGDYIQILRVIPSSAGNRYPADEDTFLVLISGFDRHRSDNLEQIWGIWGSLTGTPDPITPIAAALIRQNTPDGCNLVLAGDSMGACNCEWLINPLVDIGHRKVLSILSFAAPAIAAVNLGHVYIVRFAADLDPFPLASPLGYWFWARLFLAYGSAGISEILWFYANGVGLGYHTVIAAPGQPVDLYYRHIHYDINGVLDEYDYLGNPDPGRMAIPLETGPAVRFNPPLPP